MDSVENQQLNITEQNEIKTKTTIKDKLNRIKENITIELILIFYAIPKDLVELASQNLNLDKACRVSKKYDDAVCDALIARQGKYIEEEIAVQKLISAIECWKNVIYAGLPGLLILFIAAWSDRTKNRKICILVPIFGELLMCLSNVLNVYYFYELPLQVTMFFEAFFPAITGGPMTLYVAAFAFISDVTNKESRTFRIGVVNLCFCIARPLGSATSGILLKYVGYYGVFLLSSLMYTLSIINGFYFIKDVKEPVKVEKSEMMGVTSESNFFKSFFHIKHVKDALNLVCRKGPQLRKTRMLLILASVSLMYGPIAGEMTIFYLYTRFRFNWDAVMYSYYQAFHIISQNFGAILAMFIFNRFLKWDDAVLGLISACTNIIGKLIIGFARNTCDIYIAVTVDMFPAAGMTVLRSLTSKLCSSDEQSKMMSVFTLTEVLANLTFSPSYSWIYGSTVERHASVVFYIGAALMTQVFLIFGWFYKQSRKDKHLKNNVNDDTDITRNETEELENKISVEIDPRTRNDYVSLNTSDEADKILE